MKKVLLLIGASIGVGIIAIVVLFLGGAYFEAQRADYGWNPAITTPTFTTTHPIVLIDEGHHNASSAGFTGRYWPFARLLRADGYAVRRGKTAFTREGLHRIDVLVIANASGAARPQLFGMNIPIQTHGKRSDPAFTAAEIDIVRSWVERGGSLLLIADHAPFGESASALGSAFGVRMHKGFVEVPHEVSDPLLFSKGNGRLGEHPIVSGGPRTASINRVMTYTGQSLDGPSGATLLLRLPPTAIEYVPVADSLADRPAGQAQGLAFEYGKGRVVVLGEAGMVTAQVANRIPYGMNTRDNDNRQFVINLMQWLSRKL